ncbi:hypothetical protein [Bradyrhizobium sp.]|uniref:hypothetical protein n=1 Tax=Bradyrhizobium sp. TaxID=376 RepID=UPI0039E532D2
MMPSPPRPESDRVRRAASRAEYSLVVLDGASVEAAIDLARKIAGRTGCSVSVIDADGVQLDVIPGAITN